MYIQQLHGHSERKNTYRLSRKRGMRVVSLVFSLNGEIIIVTVVNDISCSIVAYVYESKKLTKINEFINSSPRIYVCYMSIQLIIINTE
jgi:hypothetical protein